jgi:hypothetical protein
MSIIITNIDNKTSGECKYRLYIDKHEICDFKHIREEGLVECLRKASEAVKKKQLQELVRFIEEIENN